jgi:hypothetical protein
MAASAIAGVLYLRQLKDNGESVTPREPSIERIRTDVQRGIDSNASGIRRTPTPTTFAYLRSFQRPPELVRDRSQFASRRIAPLETNVWSFKARVTQIVVRSDKDLYLIIESEGTWGCVEVPAPEHCKGSIFESEIGAIRARLVRELKPSLSPKKLDRIAQLTGVGFFGTAANDQNGARLLPLLDLKWLD